MESYFYRRRGRSPTPRAPPNASVTPQFVGDMVLPLSPILSHSLCLLLFQRAALTSFSRLRSHGTCSYARRKRASGRHDASDKRKKVPSRVGLRKYVHTPRPSLLVINATERPLFSTRVCSRSTSPLGIDLRPRGRGLKSVTRERERERGGRGSAGRGRGNCAQALPSSSWSRPSRGTALNPIKFLTDRRVASAAFPKIDRTAGSMRHENVKGNNRTNMHRVNK